VNVSVDMSEVDSLVGELGKAAVKAKIASSAHMTAIAAVLAADARNDVAVDTGGTKASIRVQGGAGYRTVVADSRAAFFLEFGTSNTAPQSFMWSNAPKASERLAKALEGIDPFD
jgi:HK97 gp10 family phage protein